MHRVLWGLVSGGFRITPVSLMATSVGLQGPHPSAWCFCPTWHTRDVVEVAFGSGWVTEHTTVLPDLPRSVCSIERTTEEKASGRGGGKVCKTGGSRVCCLCISPED